MARIVQTIHAQASTIIAAAEMASSRATIVAKSRRPPCAGQQSGKGDGRGGGSDHDRVQERKVQVAHAPILPHPGEPLPATKRA
jgi:hypothetical protein